MQLILKAKKMGIKKEEIRDFLLKQEVKELTLKVAE
ncbi:DNA-binding anti-repressor SinI [Bacillus sp. S/N-304-OC-R1]|nr:DNA-binding anti-repressor SinI [Bacillus sp. S/N-304-OC-R1]